MDPKLKELNALRNSTLVQINDTLLQRVRNYFPNAYMPFVQQHVSAGNMTDRSIKAIALINGWNVHIMLDQIYFCDRDNMCPTWPGDLKESEWRAMYTEILRRMKCNLTVVDLITIMYLVAQAWREQDADRYKQLLDSCTSGTGASTPGL